MNGIQLRRFPGVFGAFLILTGLALSDDAPRNLAEMKAKYESESEAYHAKLEKANEADRPAITEANWSRIRATARRAFDYARSHPDAPDAIDAIAWTVHGVANGYYPEYAGEIAEAYRLLLERGLDSDKVAPVAFYSAGVANRVPEAHLFLVAALERSKSRLVRGSAALGLARDEQSTARSARRVRDPIVGLGLVEHWSKTDPETLAWARAADPAEADRRAEVMFERVATEFADVRMPYPYNEQPFAELAKGELYALRHLAVGRTAPDFIGEDVRGGPIRLSDHRGQVVAVVFWATWCGPCMGEVPNERKLVAKMAGRPFTLIGIDGDDDREAAKKAMARESMTWPSVWNGGMNGGIVADWGVRAWPTVYVLDGQGVIRYQTLRGDVLDRAVEHLVAELEAESKANKAAILSP